MGVLTSVVSVLGILAKMVEQIREGIQQGVPEKEILARLADPNGVGQEILDAVKERADKFQNPFLQD
jgi:uncharacterized membrane protein